MTQPSPDPQADAVTLMDAVLAGGLAIIPLDVAYGIVGAREEAIRRLFSAKQRSYEKPSGCFANLELTETLHELPADRRLMIRTIIEKHRLPFSVVAPFRADHPLVRAVDPFVLQSSTKAGTMDMLLNAGILHDAVAAEGVRRGRLVFGSSANTSLQGSKYTLAEIEAPVRASAAISFDYGRSKYANAEGRSSTIIDFRAFDVVRVGVCFDALQAIFANEFGVSLRVPGMAAA